MRSENTDYNYIIAMPDVGMTESKYFESRVFVKGTSGQVNLSVGKEVVEDLFPPFPTAFQNVI